MKFCQPHWDQLREAIKNLGLAHLIKSGEDLVEATVQQLNGLGDDISTYDPLNSAHWNIIDHCITDAGVNVLYLMSGDYCPLCVARDALTEHVKTCVNPECGGADNLKQLDNWIDYAANAEAIYCRTQGLIPPLQ